MKILGFKMTYYMKNGKELVDESLEFEEPVDENSKGLREFVEKTKEKVQEAVKTNGDGYIVFGNLYVSTSEIQAIRFELKEELNCEPPII